MEKPRWYGTVTAATVQHPLEAQDIRTWNSRSDYGGVGLEKGSLMDPDDILYIRNP